MSREFKNKNDYSVTFFNQRKKVLFLEYVHNVLKASQWANSKGIQWDYILIHVRRSRSVLCFYKNGDYIHAKPNFINRGRIKNGW